MEIIKDFLEYVAISENKTTENSLLEYYYKTLDYFNKNVDKIDNNNDIINDFINLMNNYTKNYFGFKIVFLGKYKLFIIPYNNESKLFIYKYGIPIEINSLNTDIYRMFMKTNFSDKYKNSVINKNHINIAYSTWYLIDSLNLYSNIEGCEINQ
jgi:hypothetical protein